MKWPGYVCLLLLAGCQHPFRVQTESVVRVPDGVSGKVQMLLPGRVDAGPMLEVPISEARGGGVVSGGAVTSRSDKAPDAPLTPQPSQFTPHNSPLTTHSSQLKVAVIDLDGILGNLDYVGPYSQGENPLAAFKEKLAAAAADPGVRAVVLRLNSPGGGVAAADLMLHEVQVFKKQTGKPVVACLLDLATGGAYYVACGSDAIVACPTSVIGGMGVVLNLYYATVAMELQNVFDVSVREGPSIDMGSPARKLTPEERKLLTAMAKEYHERFKDVVVAARKHVQRDAAFFDGRIMSARDAKQAGLIDGEGYLEDALALARQLAGVIDAQPVLYRRKGDPAYSLYDTSANRPLQGTVIPYSIPGLDRSRLPLFLYMWQADPTMLKLTGQ